MSAKHKLNAAHFAVAFMLAGVAGLVTQSLTVFLLGLGALLVAGLLAGDLRR